MKVALIGVTGRLVVGGAGSDQGGNPVSTKLFRGT
jgi:hypothetical protein